MEYALIGLLVFLVGLLFWARSRNQAKQLARRNKGRRASLKTSESMFMPVAEMDEAVEVIDMDALLKGEPAVGRRPTTLTAAARRPTTLTAVRPPAPAEPAAVPQSGARGALPAGAVGAPFAALMAGSSGAAGPSGHSGHSGHSGPSGASATELRAGALSAAAAAEALRATAAQPSAASRAAAASASPPTALRSARASAARRPPTLVGQLPADQVVDVTLDLSHLPDIDEASVPMGSMLNLQLGGALASAQAAAARFAGHGHGLATDASAPGRDRDPAPGGSAMELRPAAPGRPEVYAAPSAGLGDPGLRDLAAPGASAEGSGASAQFGVPDPAAAHGAADVPGAARPLIDAPLRELTLAWFQARGYRSSPASEAVRPIQLVLRHREDPSRAYAFVVQSDRVDLARALKLLEQAQSIGLVRLLIVAEGGADANVHVQLRKKGVRIVDRISIQAEVDKLDLSVAAKIIALARGRVRPAPEPAHS